MEHSPIAELEQAALAYAARGWSVVPVEPRGKRPIVAWQEFQQRIPGAAMSATTRPRTCRTERGGRGG